MSMARWIQSGQVMASARLNLGQTKEQIVPEVAALLRGHNVSADDALRIAHLIVDSEIADRAQENTMHAEDKLIDLYDRRADAREDGDFALAAALTKQIRALEDSLDGVNTRDNGYPS